MFKAFKPDREKDKTNAIQAMEREIFHSQKEWNHAEQTELLNRLIMRVAERKQEQIKTVSEDLRQLQDSLKDINI